MLESFFTRALIAGIGLAAVTGPLGSFIVWRRMAYFGDTMAHSAILGVALALFFSISPVVGVFVIAVVVALILAFLQRRGTLSADSLLGLLSHSALALGLVMVSLMPHVRVDLMGLLFGDILAVSVTDLAIIYGGGIAVLGVLAWLWRPLLAGTVSTEIAQAEGLSPERNTLIFTVLLAALIAIAMKLLGVLLITAMLIIPATAARRLARTPEAMALYAVLGGIAAVLMGLWASFHFNTPSGPTIVVAALGVFAVTSLVPLEWRNKELK
ncbi:metal ABC transporter permease [Pelagibacterium xiamenense]|uniref:metal ABC transporter permease n=1 Tax=Pelagibacterium xiamenense TaxID=2901140 RepID=UPI001E3BDA9E|nr:metal ABC transporter permease [Pelagibacterium xiamenense]MCD7058822.1 metal ABC transporter permease [Pelagibacterium xiamenense]